MSVNGNYTGNVNKPQYKALSGTSAETVFTASDTSNTTASWAFCNTTGGAVTCKFIHNQGGTDYTVWQKSVAANSTDVESNLPLRLAPGDIIKAVGNTGVTVTVTLLSTYAFTGA